MFAAIPVLIALAAAADNRPGIGIHVAATERLAPEQVSAMGALLKDLIRGWTGEDRVLVDDLIWEEGRRSAEDVRTRLAVRDVLILELEDAGRKIRVAAELYPGAEKSSRGMIVEMPRERDAWEDGLKPIVRDFFAPMPRAKEPPLAATSSAKPARFTPLPWIAIGAGAVLVASGVLLFASAGSARDRLQHDSLTAAEARELDSAVSGRSTAGGLLAGTGACAIAGGALLWILDP